MTLKILVYVLAAVVLGIALLWAGMALTHEWYPRLCCGDRDCYAVPCAEITLSKNQGVYRGMSGARQSSPDDGCHVCPGFYYGRGIEKVWFLRCLFLPDEIS